MPSVAPSPSHPHGWETSGKAAERIKEEVRLFELAAQHAPAKVRSLSLLSRMKENQTWLVLMWMLRIHVLLCVQVWAYYTTLPGGGSREVRLENEYVVTALVKGRAVSYNCAQRRKL